MDRDRNLGGPSTSLPTLPMPQERPWWAGGRKQGRLPGGGALLKPKDSEEAVGATDSVCVSKARGTALKQ